MTELPPNLTNNFAGKIYVYHSATATYFAPSDLCGAGGLHREKIRSAPYCYRQERRDTVFIEVDGDKVGMDGMLIGRVLLFFSFRHHGDEFSCALINWFIHDSDDNEPAIDKDTGMYRVRPEKDALGHQPLQVIDIDSIVRGAHLLPIYGSECIPKGINSSNVLSCGRSFFVNHFIDYHTYELIKLL